MKHCGRHTYYHSDCAPCRQANQFQAASTDDGLADTLLGSTAVALAETIAETVIDAPSVSDSTGFSGFDGGDFGGGGAGGGF